MQQVIIRNYVYLVIIEVYDTINIIGLDPAAPGFSLNDTETRLDTSDADFVDVIHTNSGNLVQDQLSFFEPIGHVV